MNKILAVGLIVTSLLWSGCKKGDSNKAIANMIIQPNKHSIWQEGKTYKIKWITSYKGKICIEVLTGGHSHGILNDCQTNASAKSYKWHIPKGFISGFGIKKDDAAKVVIYPPNNEDKSIESDKFTIIAK